jgi:hypothetical protein
MNSWISRIVLTFILTIPVSFGRSQTIDPIGEWQGITLTAEGQTDYCPVSIPYGRTPEDIWWCHDFVLFSDGTFLDTIRNGGYRISQGRWTLREGRLTLVGEATFRGELDEGGAMVLTETRGTPGEARHVFRQNNHWGLKGDLNGDNRITVKDAARALRMTMATPTDYSPVLWRLADVIPEGSTFGLIRIDRRDVSRILRMAVGLVSVR